MREASRLVRLAIVGAVVAGCGGPEPDRVGVFYVDGERSTGEAEVCIGGTYRLTLEVRSEVEEVTVTAKGAQIFSGPKMVVDGRGTVSFDIVCTQPGTVRVEASGDGGLADTAIFLKCEPCPPQHAWVLWDQLDDRVDSISVGGITFKSGRNDLRGYGGMVIPTVIYLDDIDGSDAPQQPSRLPVGAPLDTSGYVCGQTHESGFITVCADSPLDWPAEDLTYVVAAQLAAPVPAVGMDEDHHYIYAAVFESDGQTANDWVPQAPYDYDYFQGTDRWYQVVWNTDTGTWSMDVSQVSSTQQNTSSVLSATRVIVSGDTITWFIPASELPSTNPRYRVSAFGHDGNYSASDRGGDVSGANPTEPPIAFPDELPIAL